ncbi:MAG: hypothetical protein KatS3mg109_0654 [Pirellulaceae bacterium]|nr:MAG: hypothetical protein KatS3mg109_0654 [Pirellulaceae bacterium]
MSENLKRFKQLLAQMFQLDQAELDFGIYRIMNSKREEITRFLDNDLLPQVREAFEAYEAENRGAVEAELAEAVEKARELGVDPETTQKVKEIRARLAQAVDVTALENEVFSHLYNFFRRYYSDGDFISQRRYKEGVYAIPYEGEEVKLYWANHDQYYIKTSEYFRNYTFKLPDGKRVHFKLVEADTEKDNNRAAQNGNERRFMLGGRLATGRRGAGDKENWGRAHLGLVDGPCVSSEYRARSAEKRKQADLNAEAGAKHPASLIDSSPLLQVAWSALSRGAPHREEPEPHAPGEAPHGLHRAEHLRLLHPQGPGRLPAARAGLLHQERGDAPRRHRERNRPTRGAVPGEDQGHPSGSPTRSSTSWRRSRTFRRSSGSRRSSSSRRSTASRSTASSAIRG